ncbi:MAG: hypothetical protein PWP31_1568 [Clostridia bacterium]|nr:hypothetical protein [Clostridia bacterium]
MNLCNQTQHGEYRIVPEDIQESIEVLKEGRMFINSLPKGEIPCGDMGGLGFFFTDTRFLNCMEMRINDTEPVFLSRTVRDSHFAQVELTNKEIISNGMLVPLQTIHLRLLRMVNDGFYQRLRIINFNKNTLEINLRFKLGADFADIFEIRGIHRDNRGDFLKTDFKRQQITFNYLGRDNIKRSTKINFYPTPAKILEQGNYVYVDYNLRLTPKKKNYIYLKVVPLIGQKSSEIFYVPNDLGFKKASQSLIDSYQAWKDECLKVFSDNKRFDYMLRVAITDLRSLTTNYPGVGTTLEAGIPWYAAPFGRDSLITAWQTLLVNPSLAKETLLFMAKFQGKEVNSWKDEQPGKIMHELRFGEMAKAGEIPHTPYYGSVDSTQWFIILLADYVRWTGDYNLLNELEKPLTEALNWCELYGDMDKDGFIEYLCQSEKGLVNQGWKDSDDGVIDSFGKIPIGPIALVEVQGYYYKALTDAAELFEYLGNKTKAKDLRYKAEQLQKNFLKYFWLDHKGFLAYALDGQKNQIETIVSNPGHCLFTGILPQQKACQVIKRLMKPDVFSGWGIRTMSTEEVAYNPISYHNGTVWPHDNSIIGYGFRKMGEVTSLQRLVEAFFESTAFFNHMRLPELFCGFTRRGKIGPVKYPIACDPQAWAIGSIFLMLRALLGIECQNNEIHVRNPYLPSFLQTLKLENIKVGDGRAALEFTRKSDKTYCGVIGTEGNIKVIFE